MGRWAVGGAVTGARSWGGARGWGCISSFPFVRVLVPVVAVVDHRDYSMSTICTVQYPYPYVVGTVAVAVAQHHTTAQVCHMSHRVSPHFQKDRPSYFTVALRKEFLYRRLYSNVTFLNFVRFCLLTSCYSSMCMCLSFCAWLLALFRSCDVMCPAHRFFLEIVKIPPVKTACSSFDSLS